MQNVLIFNLVTDNDIFNAQSQINKHIEEGWKITSTILSGGILFVVFEEQSHFIWEGNEAEEEK